MNIKASLGFLICVMLYSCVSEGVETKKNQPISRSAKKPQATSELAELSLKPGKTQNQLKLKNGIRINWYLKGEGEQLKDGDVVLINYEVLLMDSTMVDGNKLLNKPTLPFLVGFGMQTPGWDIAFRELRVGDFAEIYLPAPMARGEKGVPGLIPPNAPNVLRVKVMAKKRPDRIVDGTKVWLLEENKTEKRKATLEDEVEFHYMVGTKTNPKYHMSYVRSQPYVLRFSDFGIIKGLKKALINAKKADKLWVLVPPSEAYGKKGLQDLVKPNEQVFYDIFVMDVR